MGRAISSLPLIVFVIFIRPAGCVGATRNGLPENFPNSESPTRRKRIDRDGGKFAARKTRHGSRKCSRESFEKKTGKKTKKKNNLVRSRHDAAADVGGGGVAGATRLRRAESASDDRAALRVRYSIQAARSPAVPGVSARTSLSLSHPLTLSPSLSVSRYTSSLALRPPLGRHRRFLRSAVRRRPVRVPPPPPLNATRAE